MKTKTVPYVMCPCEKRGFASRQLAEKALGRAQTKRVRSYAGNGSLRGLKVEGRIYQCDESDLWHLTSQSRREYEAYAGAGR